jgi:hypothetical protein
VQAQNELKATGRMLFWTLAWMATLALARFGPDHLWDPAQRVASWAAVAVNAIAGVGWIVAITRFIRALDELQQKIVRDALAVTLGVGWVVGFAYVVADAAELFATDVDVAALPVLMGVVFMLAFGLGRIRYR